MKTLDQVISDYKSPLLFLDSRDLTRLASFIPNDKLSMIGYNSTDPNREVKEWTRENILEYLKRDVEFGFEKALNQRGISSNMMFVVVKMWNWILEEGLENYPEDNYANYGLPLFKATAVKYGFDNPIGDDSGSENKYAG